MPAIVMYTKSWCPYCDRAKALLAREGPELDRDRHRGTSPARRDEMIERSGRNTVPQIWIGDRHVGGFDELAALERARRARRAARPRQGAGRATPSA